MINEEKRLEILYQYDILDKEAEAEFDNITYLASTLCNTHISTISLIDKYRQWYKSKIGLTLDEVPREDSFCSLAIARSAETVVIEKLMEDAEFRKIGLINGFTNEGFYAGVPIKDKDSGAILGTLCVIDIINKTLSDKQIKSLEILAEQAADLFEIRRKYDTLRGYNEHLFYKYSELEKFAGVISHDMKSPLNNIISIIGLIKENSDSQYRNEDKEYLNLIEECSLQLKKYVDGVLSYYKLDNVDLTTKEEFGLSEVMEEIKSMFKMNPNIVITFSSTYSSLKISKYALIQILMNLVENGIKYNNKEQIIIDVDFTESSDYLIIKVTDNGIGMKSEHFNEIFDTFKNLNVRDKNGNYGTGLGLSSVKKIVDRIKGEISVASEVNKGTTFTLKLKK
jgi:signal transduction histidine kinase